METIYEFIRNHQLFTYISNNNYVILTTSIYVGLGLHFFIMLIYLIPFRLSNYTIEKTNIYVIASIIYIIFQSIVSYIICLLLSFFGWIGSILILMYFVLYVIIAAIRDNKDDTIFVFGLGEYPIYLSEKYHYRKTLSNNYKKFKEKNKEII